MSPDTIQPIQQILAQWILVGQALVGSIGALAFVAAFLWKMLAIQPQSVLQAKQWRWRAPWCTSSLARSPAIDMGDVLQALEEIRRAVDLAGNVQAFIVENVQL